MHKNLHHHVTMIVRSINRETDRIVEYALADPDDWELPPFQAGAHVDIRSVSGLIRQYSLCGDPRDSRTYRIAIQRESDGRGGSVALQDELELGFELPVSLPRNHFQLARDARRHILVAGGIGITPILSMLYALDAAGADYELHYCTRKRDQTAFYNRILGIAGVRAHFFHDEEPAPNAIDLQQLLAVPAEGAHAYCCGPTGLVDGFLDAAQHWDPGCVHVELFGRPKNIGNVSYRVKLARAGREIEVRAGESMLAALREAGIEIQSSCEAGVCLECKTRFLAGTPIHQDLVMPPEDRKEFLTPCVSGCAADEITLDL